MGVPLGLVEGCIAQEVGDRAAGGRAGGNEDRCDVQGRILPFVATGVRVSV